MSRATPDQVDRPAPPSPFARIALHSVSTRIVASVLIATLLTAAAVSALCIRAIHADVARRLNSDYQQAARARIERFDRETTALAHELRAASAAGTPWHATIAALAASGEHLRWISPDAAGIDSPDARGLTARELAPPPEPLATSFDRLDFTPIASAAPAMANCVVLEVEVPGPAARPIGRLSGCVARDRLAAWLASRASASGTRLLLANLRGDVLEASGPGAAGRRHASLPVGDLISLDAASLARYSDSAGRALVGLAVPIARTGLVLAVESEHARAFEPAIALTRSIFVLDVCVVLLFGVLAHRITLAIMAPIHALSSGAQRILDGHIHHQIPAPSIRDDELGLLTLTFNEMMRKLRHNQIEIERDRLRLAEKNEELQAANEVLSQLSITDGLTKLHNHRYFQDHLTREIKRVSRTHSPLTLILIDIDDFKQLNDTYGHAAGDDVLVSLAGIMNESARESDLIARYGGEEFVILMPNTDLAGAVHLAEKIRMAVESRRLIIGDRLKPVLVTISLGVALFKGNRREFFAEADRALYRAKAAGKNCVIIAGSDAPALG